MRCQRCDSLRIANIQAKCDDRCLAGVEQEQDGYVPADMGIGGGDYVIFSYCLDCGQMQGPFPLPPTGLEE